MAMIFTVCYPSGERAFAIGYPDAPLVVDLVPRGPEACLFDEIEAEPFHGPTTECRARRILAGPRRPALHVRLDGASESARDAWLDAREAEGWWVATSPDDPDEIWIVRPPLETKPPRFVAPPGGDLRTVYDRDGLDDDARALAALGARVVNSRG